MRTVALAAVVVTACVAAGGGGLRAVDPQPVTFAVVRADGILIPFATRTGERWTNAWPAPRKRVDVPLRFADLPRSWWGKAAPATTWRAWFVGGGSMRATVDKPAWYMAHCEHGIGLQTGVVARPPLPPPTVSPYPKLGLATTGDVAIHGIEALDSRHAIGAALLDVLDKPFRDSEAREFLSLASTPDSFRPTRSPAGQPGAIRLDALYRMPRPDGQFLYYLELARGYPETPDASPARAATGGRPPRTAGCEGMSVASGWFIGTATKIPSDVDVQVRLVSCDYDGAVVMQPLGYVTDAGGAFWIGQESSWERERYVVLRSNGRRAVPEVMVATDAGECD